MFFLCEPHGAQINRLACAALVVADTDENGAVFPRHVALVARVSSLSPPEPIYGSLYWRSTRSESTRIRRTLWAGV